MGETIEWSSIMDSNAAECREFIRNHIAKLSQTKDSKVLRVYLKEMERDLEIFKDPSVIAEFKKKTAYQENEFSSNATNKNIMKAKDHAIAFLENLQFKLEDSIGRGSLESDDCFTEDIALKIITRVLKNFHSHIEEMYQAKVHGKAHITKEKLEAIKIGNEYDVQRILYSILKPIFPEARLEVTNDTGYGSVRYDIFIEKYNVVIEVKCSRPSMSDKSLREELGSDIYHYQYSNVFFFVYDKDKLITNKVAFVDTYTGEFDKKKIQTVVIQPVRL